MTLAIALHARTWGTGLLGLVYAGLLLSILWGVANQMLQERKWRRTERRDMQSETPSASEGSETRARV